MRSGGGRLREESLLSILHLIFLQLDTLCYMTVEHSDSEGPHSLAPRSNSHLTRPGSLLVCTPSTRSAGSFWPASSKIQEAMTEEVETTAINCATVRFRAAERFLSSRAQVLALRFARYTPPRHSSNGLKTAYSTYSKATTGRECPHPRARVRMSSWKLRFCLERRFSSTTATLDSLSPSLPALSPPYFSPTSTNQQRCSTATPFRPRALLETAPSYLPLS